MSEPRDRVVQYLQGHTVDQPPVFPLVGRLAASVNDIPAEIFLSNATQLTTSLSKARRLFEYNCVCNCFDPTMVSEALGATLSWERDVTEYRTIEAVTDPSAVPDPKSAPERARLPVAVDAVERLGGELGSDAAVFGVVPGAFLTLYHLTDGEITPDEQFVDRISLALNELIRAYGHAGADAILILERAEAIEAIGWEPDRAIERGAETTETLANIADFYGAPVTLVPQGFEGAAVAAVAEYPGISAVLTERSSVDSRLADMDVRIGTGISSTFGDQTPAEIENEVSNFFAGAGENVFPATGWEVDPDVHPDAVHAAISGAREGSS